ncbi:MAG: glycosyltransferase family 4 protein, partial [Planctomycetaceae bacterium]|nr:glycosyltransferase family 4 protein [Planctomycetaceae bacterium]
LSGQHVLFGHLRQLAKWTTGEHQFVVLHQAQHGDIARRALPFDNVEFAAAPSSASHWTTRSAWETLSLPALMKRLGANLYFTPSGTILPRSPVPQVSLAQNPWCLVRDIHRTKKERLKASLQRSAYRAAVRGADLMVYNSEHIRCLYLDNARNEDEGHSIIAFQGINDDTHALAAESRMTNERKPLSILSVSAMAHWKGAETVVAAVAELRKRGVAATLDLVGPWPDAEYERFVRDRIKELSVGDAVNIAGKVSVDELHRYYATAQVFCLMSRCESFGIPAVEAQAFGTPVVGSNDCAMREIGGAGGVFGPPGNAFLTADLLQPLLTDIAHWQNLSENAVANSQTYVWEVCSRPLLQMFQGTGITASSAGTSTDTQPVQSA